MNLFGLIARTTISLIGPALLMNVAVAREVKVGATTLVLLPPPGYCELDTAQRADAEAISETEKMMSTNRLLAFSADCDQLSKYRSTVGAVLDNIAQYQPLISWENRQMPVSPQVVIGKLCDQLRIQGKKIVLSGAIEIKDRADEVVKNLRVPNVELLGLVAEEPTACYAALLQKFMTKIGTEKTQAVVMTATVVSSKIIYCYLYAPYTGSKTITEMLKQMRAIVTAVMLANQ